ncbi:MAG: D-2-hydroxyacid dehydrogenase [Paenisporosarcina sp.]
MVVLFTFPVKENLIEDLQKEFPNVRFEYSSVSDVKALESAEILVTYGEDLTEENLHLASSLKWIMVASAGLEKMPLKKIGELGIFLTNVRGIHKTPMAESVMAHLLALKRSLPWIYEQQVKKEWNRKSGSTELHGSVALILGPGAIGGEIGRHLQAFGVHTIGCNRSGQESFYMNEMISFEQLDEKLPEVDILISVLPSTTETRGLLTYDHFVKMKKEAIFMNFGRGDLVAEEELIRAMSERQIEYAVLDVFEKEPLDAQHPLWTTEGIIISPHVSSHSSEYVPRAIKIFKHNLREWMNQEKDFQNVIDIEKGY